jgi:hypothetical protein
VGVGVVWIQTSPWQLPQSHAYIGSNLRAAHGNKLGVRPRLDPKEKSVNERRTSG